MLKIYGRSDSSNSAKVFWLLAETGIAHERIDCGGRFGGNDTPAYLAMNPPGKVPMIDDNGVIVWESNAVLRYLGNRAEAAALWPADPARRARTDMWMDWSATALVPPFTRLRKAGGPEKAPELVTPALNAFRLLDRQLEQHGYIAGDELSLADFAAGPAAYRWGLLASMPPLPAIAAYVARLAERPAFRRCVADVLT